MPPHPYLVGDVQLFTRLSIALNFVMRYAIVAHPEFNNWHASRKYACLILLACTWFWACIHWHVPTFFHYDFLQFLKFFCFLYYICLKETFLFFIFLSKLFLNTLCCHNYWKSCTCAQLWVLLKGTVF